MAEISAALVKELRDQTGAEKEQLLDIRAHREEHPVVGAISEAAASVKARENVKVPDEGIWDQVFAQLNKAQALFAGDKGLSPAGRRNQRAVAMPPMPKRSQASRNTGSAATRGLERAT